MADSLHQGLHEERCDVFVFACDEHASDADDVQLLKPQVRLDCGDVAIKVLYRQEECLLTHLVRHQHFIDPVNHPPPRHLCYAVPAEVSSLRVHGVVLLTI